MQVRKIITHVRPHLDEIAAIWLLRKFGGERYIGAGNAPVEFATGDVNFTRQPQEKTGVVFIGIGGGKFDEHSTDEDDRKQGECAFTLVARDLNLEQDPALEKIEKFIVQIDTNGGSHPFDVSAIVKSMHMQFPEQPERVIDWAIAALEAKYNEQIQFLEGAGTEFREKAEITELRVGNRIIKMVVIESDESQMPKFARSSLGCNAAIVIQKQSSGNVQIYTDKRRKLNIVDLVKALRVEEQKQKGNVAITNWRDLAVEGKLEGVPEWYYHQQGQMLLNGSLSVPNVPPTKIDLESIKELTIAAISGENLPNHCRSGRCIGNQCRWYPYTLSHCRQRQKK